MKKDKRVMLVVPNLRWMAPGSKYLFPAGLISIATTVEKEYETHLVDANVDDLSLSEVEDIIRDVSPDVIGVSCMTTEYRRNAFSVCEAAKRCSPEIVTVLGGAHASVMPEECLSNPHVDFAVMGEGEVRFLQLLRALDSREFHEIDGLAYRNGSPHAIVNPLRRFIEDLDILPTPNWKKYRVEKYTRVKERFVTFTPQELPFIQVFGSRGCPAKCTFCSSKFINGPRHRVFSPQRLLSEMRQLVEQFGIREFHFYDENVSFRKDRFLEILEGLRELKIRWKPVSAAVYALDSEILEKMKESGCYQITLAIESGSQSVLDRLMKKPLKLETVGKCVENIKALGMDVTGLFVIGMPDETLSQIRETVRFAEQLDLDYTSFGIATPFPKTEMMEVCLRKGYLVPGFNLDSYRGMGRGCVVTDEFTPDLLEQIRVGEWDRINFKTKEKKEKIARITGITMDELEMWRVQTHHACGVSR